MKTKLLRILGVAAVVILACLMARAPRPMALPQVEAGKASVPTQPGVPAPSVAAPAIGVAMAPKSPKAVAPAAAAAVAGGPGQLSEKAKRQILALQAEKAARTPVQRKISSQLLFAEKMSRGEPVAPGVGPQRVKLEQDAAGRVNVDIKAEVTPALLQSIAEAGGTVRNSLAHFQAVRAWLPLDKIETIAALPAVENLRPADKARTSRAATASAPIVSEGDATHDAAKARAQFKVDGKGVKVGVLSDSVDYLAQSQANGNLGTVTVLPGQGGLGQGNSGEGTAMLEIIRDLAPGTDLFFATAFNGPAQFAQNILDLRFKYHCDVIVDDVIYFAEAPFQDDVIARAVNAVVADGAQFFSSAGNDGNKTANTASTWEGDFKKGSKLVVDTDEGPIELGYAHLFGSLPYNEVLDAWDAPLFLHWSDPIGASANDYDLLVVDEAGDVVGLSDNYQTGKQNPMESVDELLPGDRIIVLSVTGAGRFLRLETYGSTLAFNTSGSIKGHSAAQGAFSVAAVATKTSFPSAFTGGSKNPVEDFSSDGPRRMFYHTNGTAITPGNFSATGGTLRQKPDITAADGVATSVPKFAPFYGTSAAAPHAGAIAALLKSYNTNLTSAQIRSLLTTNALDIMETGWDRNSGHGIVMPVKALEAAQVVAPTIAAQPVSRTVAAGSSVSFTVKAAGSPLAYQWKFNGVALANTAEITGCNTESLTLKNVQAARVGSYTVVVSNAAGSVTSVAATLTVSVAPALTTQPLSRSVGVGANVTFSAKASGTGPLAYQWRCNGAALADSANVSGAKTDTLTLTKVQAAQAGSYTLLVTNAVGTATSASATLSVSAPPSITSQPVGSSVAVGSRASLSVAATGLGKLTYQWRCNGVNLKDSANVKGTATATLALSKLQTTASGDYTVVVSNAGGSTTSAVAKLSVLTPPSITTSPSSSTVGVGFNVTFTAKAAGAGPLAYQWSFNGVALADGTNVSGSKTATLTLTKVQAAQAGSYTLLVTNAVGSDRSRGATLTVIQPPAITSQPANTTVALGATTKFTVSATANSRLTYQWFFNGSRLADSRDIRGGATAALTLTKVTAARAGNYTVVISNEAGSVTSAAAKLTIGSTTSAAPVATASQPAAQPAAPRPASVAAGLPGLPVIASTPTHLTLTRTNAQDLQSATFAVTVAGSEPVSFQWYLGQQPLAGQTNAALHLPDARRAHNGCYRAVVTGTAGSVVGPENHLRVASPVVAFADLRNPAGHRVLVLGDVDGTPFTAAELPNFRLWLAAAASQADQWVPVDGALTFRDGFLCYEDAHRLLDARPCFWVQERTEAAASPATR